MAVWSIIPEFPDYVVSDEGEVRSNVTGRYMRFQTNQAGHVYVLMRNPETGRYTSRSVARLVAELFVDNPDPCGHYDSVIHKNFRLDDCDSYNLAWRPRWYAIRYAQQTREISSRKYYQCVENGEIFADSLEAAVAYGVLQKDVILSAIHSREIGVVPYTFRTRDH